MLFSMLFACAATISVNAPKSADVYITKDNRPSDKEAPGQYICKDKGEVRCEVKYYAWETYYYGSYQGSKGKVGEVPNEIKPIPTVLSAIALMGGGLGAVGFIWAWGPDENPINVD